MNLDPFRPPSGWDTPEAMREQGVRGAGDGRWTVGSVLKGMVAAFRRQPLGVLFAVCILPGLWMVPATIVQDRLVTEEEGMTGSRSFRAVAVSIGGYVWSTIWFAGQLSAALHAVRDRPIEWRRFLTGLSQVPVLFVTSMIVSIPMELLTFAPVVPDSSESYVVMLIVLGASCWLFARTALWAPFIVDARRPLWESLAASWVLTRGSAWRFFGLGLTLVCIALPLFVVEGVFAGEQFHASIAVIGFFYSLSVAQIYAMVGVGETR